MKVAYIPYRLLRLGSASGLNLVLDIQSWKVVLRLCCFIQPFT